MVITQAKKTETRLNLRTLGEHKPAEWSPRKRWNPFNSYKLLAHVDTWRHIKRGKRIPPPILVTVDPSNVCNLNCAWCNAAFVRAERKGMLSEKSLLAIADFLPHWGEGGGPWEPGVKAVCIAGGGEPLMNPAVGAFIDRLVEHKIDVGVVTNGVLINRFVDSLSQCTWVGVSVDAATPETLNKYKGMKEGSGTFDKIISNIRLLTDYAHQHNNKLGWKHPAYGVSFKYLLYKDNIGEIYQATRLAKDVGCKNIHFRPAGTTWDKVGTKNEIGFGAEDLETFRKEIALAQSLDSEEFGVYGVTHKFDSQFQSANYFSTCHAVFMTAVFEPPTDDCPDKDAFVMGLCCDRRGDSKLELLHNAADINEIQKKWGSIEHWDIFDRIQITKECPRCTYQPHNEIYEQVILNDSMTHKFI
jgi:sulfatase maturation enzyme AslB (radical SAM superfamily)